MNKFLLPFIVCLGLLVSCNSKSNENRSADNDSIAKSTPAAVVQDLNPDTSGQYDHIPVVNQDQKNLVKQGSDQSNVFNTITFKGKGAEERKKGMQLASKGDLKGAVEWFTKSIEVNPDNPDAYFYRGKAKMELKDYPAAEADLTKAIRMRPSQAPFHYFRGQFYMELKRFPDAIADFDSTFKLSPEFYDALNYKGVALANMGKHEQAIIEYDKVINLSPENALAYYNKGTSEAGLGKFPEAEETFSRAISINPKYEQAYVNRGNSRLMQNNHQGAWDDYNMALSLNPNNSDALYNSGFALKQLGKMPQACENWKRAVAQGHKLAQQQIDRYCK